jgi:hypothetical protein
VLVEFVVGFLNTSWNRKEKEDFIKKTIAVSLADN